MPYAHLGSSLGEVEHLLVELLVRSQLGLVDRDLAYAHHDPGQREEYQDDDNKRGAILVASDLSVITHSSSPSCQIKDYRKHSL